MPDEPERDARSEAPTLLAATARVESRAPGAAVAEERAHEAWSDDTAIEAPRAADLPLAEGAERYPFERELGSGGMGAVRLHLDRRIGRRIAMKALHPETAGAVHARSRFLREACVQGQLEHPAVVPVYDLGVDAKGALYFTMKRVRGVTLDDIVRQRREGAPVDETRHGARRLLSAFASVCLAVDFAHRRGVLHRDLKPANVMLGDFGEVYVLDWGLARLTDGDVSGGADRVVAAHDAPETATRAGALLGTPGYMSPEQARGDHASVGPASDVYSLGAILFELLAGEPLHRRDSLLGVLHSTAAGADARPSARAPDAGIAPELDAICVRATSLRASERQGSARELHDDVQRYLDGERDVLRRKELAEEHVAAANAAVARAREADAPVDVRRDAMREIGRALAFDPGSAGAMRALVDLLGSPPATMPPEVRFDIEDSVRRRTRWVGRVGVIGYASSVLYLPFLVWAGILEPAAVAFFYACMAGCAALSAWAGYHPRPSPRIVLASMLLSNVALATTGAFYGPLVLTPPALVANTAAYAVHLEGRERWLAIGTGALASIASIALWLGGVLPGGLRFGAEGLTILPGAVALPEVPTIALLGLLGVGVILLASVTVARLRDDLSRAERQLLLYAWHLRELVPAAARAPTDPTARRRERA